MMASSSAIPADLAGQGHGMSRAKAVMQHESKDDLKGSAIE